MSDYQASERIEAFKPLADAAAGAEESLAELRSLAVQWMRSWRDANRRINALEYHVGQLALLLWKATPHLENGKNGHPTDRYDAKLILREMKKFLDDESGRAKIMLPDPPLAAANPNDSQPGQD